MRITPKQRRFADEYLLDLNATQAAIRAGYSQRTAAAIGAENLRKPQLAELIAAGQAERSQRTEITADAVVAELAKIGFANMADYMRAGPGGDPFLDFAALSRDQAAALQEVTVEDYIDGRGDDARDVKRVKFKLADKRAALVDLGRHLGIFTAVKVEHSGSIDVRNEHHGQVRAAVAGLLAGPPADQPAAPSGAHRGKEG